MHSGLRRRCSTPPRNDELDGCVASHVRCSFTFSFREHMYWISSEGGITHRRKKAL